MKSFKVGDWVTTWDTGLAMWKRGVVEAVRTENQDWCGTGTVRVLWDVNKRGYWVPEWRLKHIKDQPKQKQSKPKFKVGDRVELRGMSLWNGTEGVIKEICDNEGVATVIFNDNCGYVIALENLKLLPKEEPKQKKLKFKVDDIVRWIGNCCNCVCGKVVDIEQKADCPIKVRWDLIEFAGDQQNYIPGSYQEADLRLATEEEKSIREAYLAASRRCVSGMKDKTACLESKVSQLQEKLNAIAKLAK